MSGPGEKSIGEFLLEVSNLVWQAEMMFSPLERWDGSYPPPDGRHTMVSFEMRDHEGEYR